MSVELLTLVIFSLVIIFFTIGTPVAFGLAGIAMLLGYTQWGTKSFLLIQTTTSNVLSGFLLLAIPLFIFMGQIILYSGIGERMFNAFQVLFGRIRGGLAVGVIVVCSAIAAMVGVLATGIMVAGTVALPSMLKRGYNKHLALGVVMAGGGMGILIPPSIPMILFSSVTNTSVGRMFAGGVFPGLIMSGLFIVYIVTICTIKPEYAPSVEEKEKISTRKTIFALRDSLASLSLITLVLGCILTGIATTTEAAAVGALGAIVLALSYRNCNFPVLKDSSIEAMKLTSMVVWILIGAGIFNNFYMMMGVGKLLRHFFSDGLGLGPFGIIMVMQVSIFFMGFIMDDFVILLMCAPIFTPIAMSLGYDPIWFGVLMILQMEIAIQTPPYGFALFYMRAVVPPGITMLDVYKSITPFLLIKIVVLLIVMFIPEVVTWLPNYLFEK
jgi:tripartite ATP-independent transporter DctM subunit